MSNTKFVEISDGTWVIISKLGGLKMFFLKIRRPLKDLHTYVYIYIYILRICWIIHGTSPIIASFLTWTQPESHFFSFKKLPSVPLSLFGPLPGWRWKRRRIQEEKCLSGIRVVGKDVGYCWWSNELATSNEFLGPQKGNHRTFQESL